MNIAYISIRWNLKSKLKRMKVVKDVEPFSVGAAVYGVSKPIQVASHIFTYEYLAYCSNGNNTTRT